MDMNTYKSMDMDMDIDMVDTDAWHGYENGQKKLQGSSQNNVIGYWWYIYLSISPVTYLNLVRQFI